MAAKESQATGADHDGWSVGQLTDPGMIRALSHPVRLSIVEHLGDSGTAATATELAGRVGLSPSATSYHLREMAKHGLIEPAESSDGRERRWRVVGRGWNLEGAPTATGERRAAEEALVAAVLARDNEKVTDWFARAGDEPPEWREAAAIMTSRVLVTPVEVAEIITKVQEVLEPYLRRNRPDPPAGARLVSISLRAVPLT